MTEVIFPHSKLQAKFAHVQLNLIPNKIAPNYRRKALCKLKFKQHPRLKINSKLVPVDSSQVLVQIILTIEDFLAFVGTFEGPSGAMLGLNMTIECIAIEEWARFATPLFVAH
jgi:hypothetical protein